jgi:Poly(ADP-ribose) polymerase catalytic domain
MKDYTKITYGLNAPPTGFDSTHGVRATKLTKSEFQDDEYVIYDNKQQRLEYLVEFKA